MDSAARHCDCPLRIRTITVFLHLAPEENLWEAEICAASTFLYYAKRRLEEQGYEVQTTRVATQPFPLYLHNSSSISGSSTTTTAGSSNSSENCPSSTSQLSQTHAHLIARAMRLEALAAKFLIDLISIGSSSDPDDLAVIPQLIAATKHLSCSFCLPAEADRALCQQAAGAIMQIAALTDGLGNFRFATAHHMVPAVPFFPVACAGGLDHHHTFAIGTESNTLLYQAFEAASQTTDGSGLFKEAAAQLHQRLLQHWSPLEQEAQHIEADWRDGVKSMCQFDYLGLDSSLAPGLDTPAVTEAYQLLGLGRFGAAGSLAVSSLITKVLKELPLRLTGYCGLMLPVCEDQGLAAAASAGTVTISQLLQYSAVCGCGLDTVPVPGPAKPAATARGPALDWEPSQHQHQQEQGQEGHLEPVQTPLSPEVLDSAAARDRRTTASIAALVADTNALAYRLNKPLACRLLPLPGKLAGDAACFDDHPYMISSHVMDPDK